MLKFVRVAIYGAGEIAVLYHREQNTFEKGSIETDFVPLANVNVFISTLVMLYRAMPPWARVVL